jgi:hypothetical protein
MGVVPINDYFAALWFKKVNLDINKIHYKALKYYFGAPQRTPLLALHGDSGWITPYTRHKIEIVRLWNRLINSPDDALIKRVFNMEYNKNTEWCKSVKTIFEEIGMVNKYMNQEICCLNTVKNLLVDLENENWKNEVQVKSKLRTYKLIKTEVGQEDFIKTTLSRVARSILFRLRSGVLPLKIETGRFRSVPSDKRICELCNLNEIENEIHFVIKCPLYEDLRQTMYGEIIRFFPNFSTESEMDKYKICMKNLPHKVARYMVHFWNRRKMTLYNIS